MASSQTQNNTYFHLLGFLLSLLVVASLVFYQLFVNIYHQRIPLKAFFSKSTLSQAFKNLKNQSVPLGKPENNIDEKLIRVDCQDFCKFFISSQPKQPIPALVDNDGKGRLEDLELHFFDPQERLIGYYNKKQTEPTFYVINYKHELMQTIRLDLNQQRSLSFVNYYPQTRQILFQSIDTNNKQEYMLYSATSPSLTLLGDSKP